MQSFRFFYKALLCCSIFSATTQASVSDSELVGSVQGNFAVSPSGSATYEIPIKLPPTIGNVQPELSLNYDSSSGNGLLGVGWNLSGLSSISRCATSLEHDGVIDPVDFDDNDQYCLDGQRMVHVSGNEYRTQVDEFNKITGGETGFTVHASNGLIKHYGKLPNNKVNPLGQPSKVMTWLLYRVEDQFGNYYTVDYQNSSLSSGEYYASEFNLHSANTLLGRIKLEYEDRRDVISGYSLGSKLLVSKRLSQINTYSKSDRLNSYTIKYSEDEEPLNNSYLSSILECDSENQCIEPIVFSQENAKLFSTLYNKIDLPLNTSHWIGHSNNTQRAFIADFNGDGLADVFNAQDNGTGYLYLSNGTSFDAPILVTAGAYKYFGHSNRTQRLHIADFNGDGMSDLLNTQDNGRANLYLSHGQGFNSAISYQAPAHHYLGHSNFTQREHISDFNGDGLSDLFNAQNNGTGYLYLSNGTSFDAPILVAAGAYKYFGHSNRTQRLHIADFNGDGMSDLLNTQDNGRANLYLSHGQGFNSAISYQAPAHHYLGHSNNSQREHLGDFNGDGSIDLLNATNSQIAFLYVNNVRETKYSISNLTHIQTPAGQIKINYTPLTNSSIYQKDSQPRTKNLNANYPANYLSINQVTPPSYVVSEVIQPDGVGGTKSTSYRYEGLRYDKYAKRNLGFSKMVIEDNQSGIRNETWFNQDYPFVGMMKAQQSSLMSSGQLLSRTDYTGFGKRDTSGKHTYFPYVSKQTSTQYLLNDQFYAAGSITKVIDSVFDGSGQLTHKTVTSSGSDGSGEFKVETYNEYNNYYSQRRQGEVVRSEVTTTAPNQPVIKRRSEFTYNWTNGRLSKEVIEPGHADKSITRVSVHGYDSFGNRTSTVTCDGRFENSCSSSSDGARFSSTQYSVDGLFPIKTTNALNQSILRTFDARFGLVTSETDINGLKTQTAYDSLGRKISSTNPYQHLTSYNRAWCDASCPTVAGQQAYSKMTTEAANTPTSVVYFDQFQREIRRQTQGFGSETIFIDTEYDAFGRVKRSSEPYFAGDTVYWTRPEYDALGRKKEIYAPNQEGIERLSSSISYQGFTTVTTDALGRDVREVKNAAGKVIKMTDKAQNDTYYDYDSLGNLLKTTDSAGNIVELEYDLRGRKTKLIDPDMGTWHYAYNVFDQLVEQRDAKNQVTKMSYDVLGRMSSRTDAFGTSQAQTASWSYYTSPQKSAGKLYQKTAANGDYTRYFYNNSYGQLFQTDQKIGSKLFSMKQSYDSLGRVSEIRYPGTTAYPSGFNVLRDYNAKGFLERVRSPQGLIYWQAEAMSPRGQLEAVTYGNGVQELSAHSLANGWLVASQVYRGTQDLSDLSYYFDEVGNLTQRVDGLQQTLRENFSYDALDRLTYSAVQGGPSNLYHPNMAFSYDELGNILSKSDVGVYSYQGCGGRPHAVCRAGGTSYHYDANGSMVSAVNGSQSTNVSYTTYNKANYMQKGQYAVTFNYDADRSRNYKSRVQNGSLDLQTYYIGTTGQGAKLFEQEISSTHGVKNIHYIYGAGPQAIATHISEGTQKRTEYLHRDHLGSLALTTNNTGQKISAVSFDPWGKRRNTDWTPNSQPSTLPDITGNIGFTGQETIKAIGLVHMNGRIYDPNIGRFLSADPLIQSPYHSQSYNRYSYVMNNPLSLIDPTGYSWLKKKIKSLGRSVKNILSGVVRFFRTTLHSPRQAYRDVYQSYLKERRRFYRHKWVQKVTGFATNLCGPYKPACAAGQAALVADAYGVHWRDAIKAGLKAGAAAYVTVSSDSPVAGAESESLTGFAKGSTTGALAGGVASMITGGKFSDGALLGLASHSIQSAGTKLAGFGADAGVAEGNPIFKESGMPIGTAADFNRPHVGIGLSEQAFKALRASDDFMDKLTLHVGSEHGLLQYTAKYIPGMNSMARWHDLWAATSANWSMPSLITNQATIPGFIGLNAVANGQYSQYRYQQNLLDQYR